MISMIIQRETRGVNIVESEDKPRGIQIYIKNTFQSKIRNPSNFTILLTHHQHESSRLIQQ